MTKVCLYKRIEEVYGANGLQDSSCNSSTIVLEPQFFQSFKSQRVKVNYGPFSIPSIKHHNGMRTIKSRIASPCQNCLITWMQAGLEYTDGSIADANSGMWLHHTIFSLLNREDIVCPENQLGERFFASGNERTPFDLSSSGSDKTGYYLGDNDKMFMMAELMNMGHHKQEVTLTMTFEFIPILPEGFEKSRPYWLDIGGCGSSDFPAKVDSVFQYSSVPFIGGITGRITNVMSHLHDGGTHVEIKKNDKIICDSQAYYKNFIHSHTDESMEHISSLTTCKALENTKPEDEWSITAHYNTIKHLPMTTKSGDLEPVMGIAMVYVAEPKDCPNPYRRPRFHKRRRHLRRNIILISAFLTMSIGFFVVWTKKNQNTKATLPMAKYIAMEETPKDVEIPLMISENEIDV